MSVDIEKILLELEQLPDYDTQLSLQGVKGNLDPNYGTGHYFHLNHEEEEFTEFLFSNLQYTNSVIKELGLYRTRLMKLKPKTCYSYHQDPTKRIHIPLITNENCFLIMEKEVIHLPADGNHYVVDTTKKHTAVNASFEERIHIVGCFE